MSTKSTKNATISSGYSAEELRKLRGAKNQKDETTSKRLWTNEYMDEYAQKRKEQEESYNRGAEILNAQREKDRERIPQELAGDYASQTVRDLVMPTRVSPTTTGVSASDAFRNSQNKQALEDSVNQILGNAVTTDEGKRQQLYNTFDKAINTNPQTPSTYSYSSVMDYGRAQNRNEARANSMVNNAILSDAQRKQREKDAEEARAKADPKYQARQVREEREAQNRIDAQKSELEALKKQKQQLEGKMRTYRGATAANSAGQATPREVQAQIAALNQQIAAYTSDLSEKQTALDERIRQRKLMPYTAMQYAEDFGANSKYDASKFGDAVSKRINGVPIEYDPLTGMTDDYLDQLTNEQKGIYNYLLNTSGEEDAKKFIEMLRPDLEATATKKAVQKAVDFSNKNAGTSLLATLATIPASSYKGAGAIGAAIDAAQGNGVRANAAYNRPSAVISGVRTAMDEKARKDISNLVAAVGGGEKAQTAVSGVLSLVNNALLSGLDSAWNAMIGKTIVGAFGMGIKEASQLTKIIEAIPEAERTAEMVDMLKKARQVIGGATQLTTAIMGMAAVPDAIRSAKERGLSDEQALAEGYISGLIEYATEHITVENLFNTDWTPRNLKDTLRKGLQQANFEGLEEVNGEILDTVADRMIAQGKSEWQKSIDEYKSKGDSDEEAFGKTLLNKAGDVIKSYISGFISTAGSVGGEVFHSAAYDNQTNGTHNKVQSYDLKNGTKIGQSVDAILVSAIQKPKSEWTDALADMANALNGVYKVSTITRVGDYLNESVYRAGSDLEAAQYKMMADYLRQNKEAVSNAAKSKTAQTGEQNQTQQEETAQQNTPVEASDENPPVPAPVNEAYQEEVEQNAPTTEQSVQHIAQTAQEAVEIDKAEQTGENVAVKNVAQNTPVNASEDITLNSEKRVGAEVLNLNGEADPIDAAYSIMDHIRRRHSDASENINADLRKKGVRKAAIDYITRKVSNAINSGKYSAEQMTALKSYASKVESEIRNNWQGIEQMKVNLLSDAINNLYGVDVIVDQDMAALMENPITAERGKMVIDPKTGNKTIHLSPYLDTDEAIAGVLAHELFHNAERDDATGQLLTDLSAYRNKILQNGGKTSSGGNIDLYTDADYVSAYAMDLMNNFGTTEAGNAAFEAYLTQNPGANISKMATDLFTQDPNAFWSYFTPNAKTGETAQQYLEEEIISHFIEDLASDTNSGLINSILADDRNLIQRIIDKIRQIMRLPAKERRFSNEEAYKRLADRLEKSIAKLANTEAKSVETQSEQQTEAIPNETEFRMSREVERVGDLIAVHNLTEDKYLASHKLGGFPAPSIAVVKAKTGHSDFGPISVVFGADTIDPKRDSRNRIYGGDAWTPMFPGVWHNWDDEGRWAYVNEIYDLITKAGAPAQRLANKGDLNYAFKDAMTADASVDGVLDWLSSKRAIQAAYVAAHGDTLKSSGIDMYAELDAKAPVDKVAEWMRPTITKLAGEGTLAVNGEDLPLTAENVVKAMYARRGSRGVDIYEADANGLRSMAAPEYGSIEEVRENKDKLKRLSDREYRGIVQRLDNYILSIMDEMRDFNNNRENLDYDKAILDSIRNGGTDEDIRDAFEEEGIAINQKLMRDVHVIFNLASQLPTDFFEAKPERVVGMDEVLYYIIPNDIEPSTAQMMEQDGATVLGYTAGDEKERLKLLNSLKSARFSREINTEQTETQAFKNWFGDSKVVDENGDPIVLYHGTDYYKPIEIFKGGKSGYLGPGIYLTPKDYIAQRYADKSGDGGTVYAVWARIENPLTVTSADPAQEILREITGSDRVYNNRMSKQAWSTQILTKADMNKLRAKGYDGIIWKYGKSPAEYLVFESNQIKSATDNSGNFDSNDPNIRHSKELDKSYMDAVESNNVEEEQRIVNQAADESMPDSKIRDKQGHLIKVYHGTDADFNVFDPKAKGGQNGTAEGFGIYLTDNPEVSKSYGDRQIGAYANITHPAYGFKKTIKRTALAKLIRASCEAEAKQMMEEDSYPNKNAALKDTWVSNYEDTYRAGSMSAVYNAVADNIIRLNDNDADIINEVLVGQGIRTYDRAMDFYHEILTPTTGIDGIWTKWKGQDGTSSNIYLAFDSSQIKSADPVTYDDNKNVIPVSERFNTSNPDIRRSKEITPEQDAEYMRAVESGDEETAQRMVDEVAAQNGYTTKIYHGTTGAFTVFDREKGGKSNGMARLGFWFTPNEEGAKYWAENIAWWGDNDPHVIGAYVKLKNPKIYETTTGNEQERNETRMLEISRILSDMNDYGRDIKDKYAQDRNYPALFTLNEAVNGKENRRYVESGQLTEEEYRQIIQEANDIREKRESVANLNEEYAELSASDAYEKLRIEYYKNAKRKASDANVGGLGMQINNGKEVADKMRELLEKQGYDGIIVKNTSYDASAFGGINDQYVVFEPEQIKDSAPVTYDDNGNVIPLSERFDQNKTDIRWSRELESLDEKEMRKRLRDSEDRIEYLKKQLTQRTAFGAAQAIKPEDFNKEVRRYYDMVKYSDIPIDEISTGLRELFDIFERPLKGQNDTAESRWNEAMAKAEELAGKWAGGAVYEKVLNPVFGEKVETYKDIYSALRKFSGFYIIPEMVAQAGDKESFRQMRKSLAFMHLLGVDSNKAGVATGRMSIDSIYTDLARDYPEFFDPDVSNDYDKLQRIADVGETAYLAAHNPYTVTDTLDEESAKIEMRDDLLHRFFDIATPTKASTRPSENDVRAAYAQGQGELGAATQAEREAGYEAGYRQGKFENEAEVGAARMREDMMEQRFKENAEHLKKTLNDIIDAREKQIERLENRLASRDKKAAADMARNALMRRLSKFVRLLENPTKKEHIPQHLRGPAAKLLESFGGTRIPNGQTVSTAAMQNIQRQEADELRHLASDIMQGLTGMDSAAQKNNLATEKFIDKLTEKVNELNALYARMETLETSPENRVGDLATTQNVEYMKQMTEILDMALHAIRDENTFVISGKNIDANELATALKNDLKSKPARSVGSEKRTFGSLASDKLSGMSYDFMSADLFFSDMGEDWTKYFAHSYREGQNRQAKHESTYVNYAKDLIGDYSIRNAGHSGKYVTLNIGKNEVKATRGQLMQIYALWNRPAGRMHLENGGACFINDRGEENSANTYQINRLVMDQIASELTEQEKRIATGLVRFMSTECASWGNDASMYMYGYRMYEDPFYIPLDVVTYALQKDIGATKGNPSIENAPFTHAVKKDPSAPLRITDIFDVTDDHVRRMAAYNAYAPINNDVNRVLKMPGLLESVQNKMGKKGLKYLTDFVKTVDANEVRSGDMAESAAILQVAMNAYKRQAVSWNVSTMLKQPISLFRAANEISGKYLTKANVMIGSEEYNRIVNAMESNSGVAYIKSNGYSDVGFGSTMRKLYSGDYVNDSGVIRGALTASKVGSSLVNAYDKFIDAGMAGAGKADEMTWVRIWKACELEVSEEHPELSGDEYTRQVTERFNDVIGKTQVVDTILDTAPLMRNKGMQVFTPFMNEPTKTLGGLITAARAISSGKNGAKKAFGKAVGLWAVANLLVEPLITTAMTMWRDEKDDTEDFWNSFLEKMFGISKDGTTFKTVWNSNVVDGLFSFPIVNIIYDVINDKLQGWGSEKIDVAALGDMIDASKNLFNGYLKSPGDRQKTMYRLWGDWIESTAATLGIPVRTIRRQLAGTARGLMDITNANGLKWEYAKLYYNLANSNARSQKGFYDILASTYIDGDLDTYQKMMSELNEIVTDKSTLIDEKSLRQAIEKRGAEIKPGTDIWNLDVQARFRLDQPVKGWKVENFITGAYVQAQRAGIDESVADDCLLNMPDAYEYTDEDGDKIKMNPADYLQYAADVGQLSYRTLTEMSSGANAKQWASLNADQKVVAIRDVYKYCKAKFKKDYNEDYDINHQGKWMTALYDENATPAQIAKAALEQGAAYERN